MKFNLKPLFNIVNSHDVKQKQKLSEPQKREYEIDDNGTKRIYEEYVVF